MTYRLKRGYFTDVNGVAVTKRPHPNHTNGWGARRYGEGIVFHFTVGCQSDIYNTLTTRKISTHFCVGRDGEIFQYVRLGDRAWHADAANDYFYGIEHAATIPGGACELNDKQLEASAKLSAAIAEWAWRRWDFTIPLVHTRGPELIPGFKDHRDGDGILWNYKRHWDHLYNWTWGKYLARVTTYVWPYDVDARKDERQRQRNFRTLPDATEFALPLVEKGWRVVMRKRD